MREVPHMRHHGVPLFYACSWAEAGTLRSPTDGKGGESNRMLRSDSMFALVFENSKVFALYLLIGVTIVLSHFGRKPAQSKTEGMRTDVSDVP
jgi:hypothetical protein